MFRSLISYLIDFTGLVVISVLICLVSAGGSLASGLPFQIPASVLQLNTIFISILIRFRTSVFSFLAGAVDCADTADHICDLQI